MVRQGMTGFPDQVMDFANNVSPDELPSVWFSMAKASLLILAYAAYEPVSFFLQSK